MSSRPAEPADFLPRARAGYAGEVTVTYYRAQATVNTPYANGSVGQDHLDCNHLHRTREQADACAGRIARRAEANARAAFAPCSCHGATPSRYCAEQTEPLRFWCEDGDPRAAT
jgi:hypothetical protein